MVESRTYSNECRRKINRINTRFSGQVKQPILDEYINEAFRTWYRNNAAKFEINSETRNDLRIFEIKGVNLEFEKKTDRIVAKFPKNYYKLTSQKISGSIECDKPHLPECEGCNRTINVRIVQSGEIEDALKDPYWKPSFEWGETIADEASDGLHIWHSNQFCIDKVQVDYLRKPKEFRCPSLMKEGFYEIGVNKYTVDQPLELDPIRAHEVSDLVALFVARDFSDGQEYQLQIDKILNKERIYLS